MGRRPREHLHARQRRPPGRTTPQAATASGSAETLTNLNRGDPPRAATDRTTRVRVTPRSGGARATKPTRSGSRWVAKPRLGVEGPPARVTCPYWCGPRACGHAAASRNAVGRCAPDNRARTIAPWPYLAVPYRSTSGSLTALHASELTGWAICGAPEANCSWLSVRPAVRGGRVTRVGRFWVERAHAS